VYDPGVVDFDQIVYAESVQVQCENTGENLVYVACVGEPVRIERELLGDELHSFELEEICKKLECCFKFSLVKLAATVRRITEHQFALLNDNVELIKMPASIL